VRIATASTHAKIKAMTLATFFIDRLRVIYDAETRFIRALQQMAQAATCTSLKEAFLTHLEQKKSHVTGIESIFRLLGEDAVRKTSESIVALLYESHDIVDQCRGFPLINAALLAAVQKIEHYEIASYGCLRDWAETLGHKEAAAILQTCLEQDLATNQALTELARARSNREALSQDPIDIRPVGFHPIE
jgi:ferritin-like metal-binding protein YciE